MNRRRSKAKSGFPRNLYESRGYYSWRNPKSGDEFPMGRDRARAFEDALALNLHLAKLNGHVSAVERVFGNKQTVAEWETKYQAVVAKRGLTKETRSNYLAFSRRIIRMFGEKALRSITAQQVSDALEAIAEVEGIPRTAQAVRAYMRLSFETAVAAGWIDANPVRANIIIGDKAAKRARLSLEIFHRVYHSDIAEWLRNAMALALTSAQRREDVARAEFKDFREGGWWLTQASEKTDHPHRIFVPNELAPRGFACSLGTVVAQCRRSGVVSRFVVHQTIRRGRSSQGRALGLQTVSSAFTHAVHALGHDFSPKTPPTFHEIRSLALRLYGEQGVNVQLLAGHSDPDTTAIYLDSRGQDYAKVTV